MSDRWTILLEFVPGDDCEKAKFYGVYAPTREEAVEWGNKVARHMGLQLECPPSVVKE